MKTSRKLLALLLTLVMIAGMIPVTGITAFAAEEVTNGDIELTEAPAEGGSDAAVNDEDADEGPEEDKPGGDALGAGEGRFGGFWIFHFFLSVFWGESQVRVIVPRSAARS